MSSKEHLNPVGLAVILLALAIIFASSTARCEDRSPYEVEPTFEVPLTLGTFAAVGTPRLFINEIVDPPCPGVCDPSNINGLDRYAISRRSSTWATVSDIMFFGSFLMPHALGAMDQLYDGSEDGWEGYGKDALVLGETLAFTLLLNENLSVIFQRARPLAYNPDVPAEKRLTGDSALSFPSGHVAGPFAMATAYTRLFYQRHPDSPMVWPIAIGMYGMGVLTAVGRMEDGQHFPTDVIAGAMMGTSMGLIVPWLHEGSEERAVTATAVPGGIGLRYTH